MAASYLHGVETIEIKNGSVPVTEVKTAIIAMVGLAPKGEKQKPTLVTNASQAAQFGAKLPGFNIPKSLEAIFKQGAGSVVVVNVFDEATHTTQITDEAKTVTDGRLKLSAAPIGAVTIKDNAGTPVTYIADTDYYLDEFGNFKVLSSAIPNGTSLKFTYKKLNSASVTPAHIIGTVDTLTGSYSGMEAWKLCFQKFGFQPKILIAPMFSSINSVAMALVAAAESYRAICYLDAPYGTTVQNAVTGRGPAGSINFNTSSNRAELLYPFLKRYDAATNANEDFPYSAFKAGVRAAVDISDGYWYSDDYREIKGIVGVERDISAAPNDPNTDVQLLNSVGITTVYNSFGSGIRTFGNRSAAYPASTAADNFICVRRVADILNESVEYATMQFIGRPINKGLIDSIRESVNSFMRLLVRRGALIDGECLFRDEDNTPEEIAAGHLVFFNDFMPPTPGERITFKSFIDIDKLKALLK